MATSEERDHLVSRHCKHDLEGDYQSCSKETRLTVTDAVLKGCTVILPNCEEVSRSKSEEHIVHRLFPTKNGSVSSSVTFQSRSVFSRVLCSGIPLKCLASIFGLWPIKRKWQFIIFAIVMIVSFGVFTLAAYVCVSCYVSIDSANSTCVITGMNEKAPRGMMIVILSSFFYLLAPFSVLLSNLLLFHYVVKNSQKEGVTSFLAAYSKTDDLEWFLINLQILTTCLARVVVLTCYLIELPSHYSFALNILQLSFLISGLNMSVACWIFAMITCALRNKVSSCYRAIRMRNEGSLDDIIDQHQHMCDDVFRTCRALQPWFVSHWILFGTSTAGTVFLGVLDFKNNYHLFFSVLMVVYLFLMPCFYAARLTANCQYVLRKFNYIRARDWGVTHPLRRRVTLNHFLFYALQARCGFRVFSFNFGDSFAWLSLVFGVVAMIAKVVYSTI